MTADDLRAMRTVVANLNCAYGTLETRSERFFERQTPAALGWLRRAEQNLAEVIVNAQDEVIANPEIWNAPIPRSGALEEHCDCFSALLDMFVEVDPEIVHDPDPPLTLPADGWLVREEAQLFASVLLAA